ncbi:hypothetical protein INT47_008642 [Mucor saturninus]|uniref:Uncharacterized protein n=1 Tax=Mucor saturninus TaxID=64648 RepID=A0A8H7QVI3_9FUNG|nr:hypothetical protein INT47_008642 [Mucor saturninus]
MSRLFEACDEYKDRKKSRATIIGFINDDTGSQAYKSEEKLNDNTHTRLTEIMRVKDDEKVLDIYLNWLNRKDENTNSLRSDVVIKHYDMKLSGTTLGYCGVKPADSQHDVDCLFTDLIRLAMFSPNTMSRKDNKIACSLQAVGSHCLFYVVSSICNDMTIMNEVISPHVPMQIKELGTLNTITDELKQMSKIYDNYCLKRYVSDIEDDDTNINDVVSRCLVVFYDLPFLMAQKHESIYSKAFLIIIYLNKSVFPREFALTLK